MPYQYILSSQLTSDLWRILQVADLAKAEILDDNTIRIKHGYRNIPEIHKIIETPSTPAAATE
jgi:hypothetical protein